MRSERPWYQSRRPSPRRGFRSIERRETGVTRRVLLAAVLISGPRPVSAADPWTEPDAPVRFHVTTRSQPSHPTAGLVVEIPDGGILPSPGVRVAAHAPDAGPRPCAVVRHDRQGMLTVVVGASASRAGTWIYVAPAPATARWSPGPTLTPGVLLYTRTGGATMDSARKMAEPEVPGRAIHLSVLQEPALGGSPTGRPDPFSAYMVGHLDAKRAGKTWIAVLGTGEVRVDGRALNPSRISERSGGTGEMLDLSAGTHRVEAFIVSTQPGRDPFRIAWRPPDTPAAELGAGADGEPDWEARPIRPEECLRSGEGQVDSVESRDGAPVAAFTVTPGSYFLFDRGPVVACRLSALRKGWPAGTAFAWDFGRGCTVTGQADIVWAVDGDTETPLALRVRAGSSTSACSLVLRASAPGQLKARMDALTDRNAWRKSLLLMLQSLLPGADPGASFGPAVWDLALRLVEPVQGRDFLAHLVTRRWKSARPGLDPAQRRRIEDLFLEMAWGVDPAEAVRWVQVFDEAETDPERKRQWQLRRIENLVFYQDRPDEAIAAARALIAAAPDSRSSLRAQVRMGDAEFLRGRLDEATRHYGAAQDRARPARAPAGVAAWKVNAIRSTSVSETARNLLRQENYEEARRVLDDWELEFPMDRVSGDALIVESQYLMRLRDYARAQRLLGAYCACMDLTNYLPEALRLYMTTIFELRQGDRKLEEFVRAVRKRFPNHPIGEEAAAMIRILRAHEVERQPTLDRL